VRFLFIAMTQMPYLILNESTLFYVNLSATKTSEVGKIQNWTAQVAKANKSKVPHPGTVTQAFTSSSTTAVRRTTTSSSAVVTQAVPITKPLKKRTKFEPKAVTNLAAFLDEPEDESAEREAALSSPIKGNQRLTSKVRCDHA
jgi:hypothetical protein